MKRMTCWLICLLCLAGPALAQPSPWENTMQMAKAAETRGKYDEAARLYARAVEEADTDDRRIDSHLGLGQAYRYTAKPAESARAYRTALALQEQRDGQEHPRLIETLRALAWVSAAVTKDHGAVEIMSRALAIAERAHGPKSMQASGVRLDLGGVHLLCGQPAKAEEAFLRAIADYETAQGAASPYTRSAAKIAARSFCNAGEYARAEPMYRKWLAVTEKANGPFGDEIGEINGDIAYMYALQGRDKDAEPYAVRMSTVYKKTMGRVSLSLTLPLLECYAAQGRAAEAETLLRDMVGDETRLSPHDRPPYLTARALMQVQQYQELLRGDGPLLRPGLSLAHLELTLPLPGHPSAVNDAQRATAQNTLAKAAEALRQVVSLREEALANDKGNNAWRTALMTYDIALAENNLAACLILQGNGADAEAWLRKAIDHCAAAREQMPGKPDGAAHPRNGAADASPILVNLAMLRYQHGYASTTPEGRNAVQDSLRLYGEAQQERGKMRQRDVPADARLWLSLAVARSAAGDAAGATAARNEAIRLFATVLGADAPPLAALRALGTP
ncbi:MAG TPA: tetratricopeptide repeat protein [Armatimonadota bacterium]|nr:tetratricopeptide repeat protein [Armatimonadota bacterium]